MNEMMLNQNPMSSSEDNESKSYPELDESALLVAQVKLPRVFENLTVGTRVSSLVTQGHFRQIRSGCLVAINSPPPRTINGWLLRVKVRLFSFESNPPRSL